MMGEGATAGNRDAGSRPEKPFITSGVPARCECFVAPRSRRFVQDRIKLLAAIGHDLRAPLTA